MSDDRPPWMKTGMWQWCNTTSKPGELLARTELPIWKLKYASLHCRVHCQVMDVWRHTFVEAIENRCVRIMERHHEECDLCRTGIVVERMSR